MAGKKLSKLELRIMETLWTRGEASIREMQEAFPEDGRPGYTDRKHGGVGDGREETEQAGIADYGDALDAGRGVDSRDAGGVSGGWAPRIYRSEAWRRGRWPGRN